MLRTHVFGGGGVQPLTAEAETTAAEQNLIDFLDTGFNAENCTVLDETDYEYICMTGKKFYQGLLFCHGGTFDRYAEISFNVEDINSIVFTLGHLDDCGCDDGNLLIYLDNQFEYSIYCSPTMNNNKYRLDTSNASQIRFLYDGINWGAAYYAIANIVLDEDFSVVPEGSYNEEDIQMLGLFYEPTETTEPMQIYKDGKVYNDHTYRPIYREYITTWKDAQAYCQSLGGHLATISDSGEQDFVHSLISEYSDYYWLGGYYTRYNDTWAWVDGTEFSYTNWGLNQPGFSNANQYCLAMAADDQEYAAAGKWNDLANNTHCSFVCEWDGKFEFKHGDANLDGEINVRDCAYIASTLSKGDGSSLHEAADFNRDGKLNVRDAAAIAKYLAS